MDNRIIFLTGEGIGNVVQTFPTLRTLHEVLGFTIDFCHMFGSYSIDGLPIPYVDNVLTPMSLSVINPADYLGKVSTIWTANSINAGVLYKLPQLTKIYPLSTEVSEVSTYMNIARELGVSEDKLLWDVDLSMSKSNKEYDVIIANGYNRFGSAKWVVKSYPYYKELAVLLRDEGLSVASIGSSMEYVAGTINETGKQLYKSISMMKSCKCLVSNDTGMYHVANLLKVPNVVIFTATSTKKNYDSRFHRYSKLVYRDDLKCRPCQKNRRWVKDCSYWKCRRIPPEKILKIIKEFV